MIKSFEERILGERKEMRLDLKDFSSRVDKSPYGPKTKKLLHRWIECESPGSVGFGMHECFPVMQRGLGATITDADGRNYIDLISGFSVSNVGLCHPKVVEAIKTQATQLIHYFDLPTPPRIELSERLIEISPGDFPKKVLYGTTGGEAVDIAMRLSRWFTGKPFILTPYGDYHGVTTGPMALTGKGGIWSYYYPNLPANSGVAYFPYPYCYRCPFDKTYPNCDIYCVKHLHSLFSSKETPFGDPKSKINNVAAIFIEPFQGSAGYIIPPKEYLLKLRELCDKYDILLVTDEIQSGMGRTGKMWASDHSGVASDIMIVGKSLAGGLALSAIIGKKEIMNSWGPGASISTFGGSVLSCAVANQVLEIMKTERIIQRAEKTGRYFLKNLQDLSEDHPIVGNVDGKGLFIGIEFVRNRKTKEPADEETSFIGNELLKEGVVCEDPAGYYYNRINLLPSLVISEKEIDEAVKIFDRVLHRTERKFGIRE